MEKDKHYFVKYYGLYTNNYKILAYDTYEEAEENAKKLHGKIFVKYYEVLKDFSDHDFSIEK